MSMSMIRRIGHFEDLAQHANPQLRSVGQQLLSGVQRAVPKPIGPAMSTFEQPMRAAGSAAAFRKFAGMTPERFAALVGGVGGAAYGGAHEALSNEDSTALSVIAHALGAGAAGAGLGYGAGRAGRHAGFERGFLRGSRLGV